MKKSQKKILEKFCILLLKKKSRKEFLKESWKKIMKEAWNSPKKKVFLEEPSESPSGISRAAHSKIFQGASYGFFLIPSFEIYPGAVSGILGCSRLLVG